MSVDDIPEYYALQAALYAYLLGVDNVIMVASFLEEKDYANPEQYKPSVKNTITKEFKVSERYPDFADKVARVEKWWKDHVDSGISPVYDERKDAEILKGAISAKAGEKLLIPINMRDGCIIGVGKGNEDWKKELPEVAAKYTRTTETRRFTFA